MIKTVLNVDSWRPQEVLREKRMRKRAERRAAEFKELRENEVNKIFSLAHRVRASMHKVRKGIWQIKERRR